MAEAGHPSRPVRDDSVQQELLQDEELLPHEDELLPQDEELLPQDEPEPQDEEPPPEQPPEELSPPPAAHQDESSPRLPWSCTVDALEALPAAPYGLPVGHPPRPAAALEPCAAARAPRSAQARRHARRTTQVTTVTSTRANPPTKRNAINTTSPLRRAAPGLPAVCPAPG
ncbi:hypothetical protein [Streptomyces sp. AHA2]|uniref:hypothetical protein n=1 Tax=Streptomyces sp. AHA2 TaxID=3064526 RepID=UPI002FE15E64